MLPGQSGILAALAAALAARGYGDAKISLQPIEPPRDWGVTTNVCFTLAGRAAQTEIAQRTAGMEKKEAKALAAEITREAGPKLAAELATELQKELEGAGPSPRPGENGITGRGQGPAPSVVNRVEAEGAYINYYYDPVALSQQIISQALAGDYGKGAPTGKRIMVEYAQPNTHKDFHVGHLRNASIGQAIANVLEFEGNEVKKATYIGDVGAHVAKAIVASRVNAPYEVVWFESYRDRLLRTIAISHPGTPVDDPRHVEVLRGLDNLLKEIRNHSFNEHAAPTHSDCEPLELWGEYYRHGTKLLDLLDNFWKEIQSLRDSRKVVFGDELLTPIYLEIVEQRNQLISKMSEWLKAWEKSPETVARMEWQQSRDACVEGFQTLFAELELDIAPDCWFYESTVDDTQLGQRTAQELKERGVAVVDDSEEYKGALYVDFAAHVDEFPESERKRIRQLGKMTILRSDGTSLYQTKELGLAKYKFDNFAIDESLYVVGSEQKLYFEQVFAILRLWGFPNAENCRHIAYELVVLPEGKMSSREGTVVSYRELRDEAVRRATEITREKGIVTEDVDKTAKEIAIAAIKYAMLQVSGNQQIVFDFEQALSFDGRAAPYLQYAYARAGKLVDVPVAQATSPVSFNATGEKGVGGGAMSPNRRVDQSGAFTGESPVPPQVLHPSEIALTRTLSLWPAKARDAAQKYEPAVIANYLYELADSFNAFYRDCRVLDAPAEVRPWRQDLTRAFRAVMKTGFELLALPLPEAM